MDPTTTQFSQHVSIAYFKVDDYAAAAARFEHRARLGAMRPTVTEEEIANDEEMLDGARHAQHAAQELWGEIWSQLDEARQVAHRLGRDARLYDETRAVAREYGAGATLEVGPWQVASGRVYTRSYAYSAGPAELMRHAIATLLAIVPEAELPKPTPPEDIPDLGKSKLGLRVMLVLGVGVVIALGIAAVTVMRGG